MASCSTGREGHVTIAACLKWFTPQDGDDRYGGISLADSAALEWALRLGDAWAQPVVVVALGPPVVEGPLRNALACGASRAIRIDAPITLDSVDVAAALATVLCGAGGAGGAVASFVCCGDYSLDRGTGSVPAFLAARLAARQALGLVDLEIVGDTVIGGRRLDGGRRERVVLTAPSVLSVEGATSTPRRAGLSTTLAARSRPIEIVPWPATAASDPVTRPYRPRARVLPAPAGESSLARINALLSSGVAPASHGVPITLDPPAAADRIVAALTEWGYLP